MTSTTELSPFLGSTSAYTRQQLRANGLCRIHRDVYVHGPATTCLDLRVDAALLLAPDAHVSRETAGLLWRLPVDDDGQVRLTRRPDAPVSRSTDVVTHRARLHEDDVDVCAGRPVTSLARTFVDLAHGRSLERLVVIGDVVLRRVGAPALQSSVERAGRRKGVTMARAALPLLDPASASGGETRCRLMLHGAGFPDLRHAVVILDEGGQWLCEADLADPVARVAIQYDGLVHFTDDVDRRRRDIDRDELARQAGWEVVVLTALDLRDPLRAVAKVRAAYGRAAVRRRQL